MTQPFDLPTFIVNLDRCKDRYDQMEEELNKIGLTPQRISAVQGSILSNDDIAKIYCPESNKKYAHRDLTSGEIGCYMSHRNIWKKMIDENISLAIVLEDDVFVDRNILSLSNFKALLSAYDLIKLADNRNTQVANSKDLDDIHKLVSYSTIPNCTTGYAITLAGAKKMLSREKIYRPVDIDIQHCYEFGVSVAGIKPYPVTENKKWESEIAKNNGGKHSTKSTFLRNLKYRIKLAYYRQFYTSSEI